MKNIVKLILLSCLLTSSVYAQHIGVKVSNKGIQNLLTSAINSYGSNKKNIRKITVPEDVVYERIKKDFFDSNPVVSRIRQFINFEQNEDLVFYFKWSPISVDANMISKSLKVNVTGEEREFQATIKLSLDRLNISGRYLELCELKKWKCDKKNALYGRFNKYAIRLLKGSKIDIAAVTNVKVLKGGKVELKLKHFLTNLKKPENNTEKYLYSKFGISTSNTAKFDINFSEFIIPPPVVTVNGESFELNVSKLKDAILAEKQYLSAQLATFAGGFVAKDLAGIINRDLLNKLGELKTTINLLNYDERVALADYMDQNPTLFEPPVYTHAVDNTYVAPAIDYSVLSRRGQVQEVSFMDQLQGALKMFIHQAKFDLTYLKTKTKNDKELMVDFSSSLELNGKRWTLKDKLRNGKGKLKYPNFESLDSSKYDIAVAVSEPLFNGVLNLAEKQNLIQNVIDEVSPMPGVYIRSVRMHFEEGQNLTYNVENVDPADYRQTTAIDNTYVAPPSMITKPTKVYDEKKRTYKTIKYRTKDAVVAVVNMKVNLYEQPSDGIGGWIENQIGGLLEGGWVWFPIEVKFYPQIVEENGKTFIELYASDPFGYNGLKNSYGYPYKDMQNIVHKGLLNKLKEMLKPALNDLPKVDITNYLNLPGVKLQPVSVSVKKTGHLLIAANIVKLDLKELSKASEEESKE
jgi:hypothetical protein